jgi:YggT family protein
MTQAEGDDMDGQGETGARRKGWREGASEPPPETGPVERDADTNRTHPEPVEPRPAAEAAPPPAPEAAAPPVREVERRSGEERRVRDEAVEEERRMEARRARDRAARERRLRVLDRVTLGVDYAFYLLYGLLTVRFVLSLLGAAETAGFVQFIHGITGPFYAPFGGIVASPSVNGGVLDFPVVIALLAYVLLHLAVRGLLRVVAGDRTVA